MRQLLFARDCEFDLSCLVKNHFRRVVTPRNPQSYSDLAAWSSRWNYGLFEHYRRHDALGSRSSLQILRNRRPWQRHSESEKRSGTGEVPQALRTLNQAKEHPWCRPSAGADADLRSWQRRNCDLCGLDHQAWRQIDSIALVVVRDCDCWQTNRSHRAHRCRRSGMQNRERHSYPRVSSGSHVRRWHGRIQVVLPGFEFAFPGPHQEQRFHLFRRWQLVRAGCPLLLDREPRHLRRCQSLYWRHQGWMSWKRHVDRWRNKRPALQLVDRLPQHQESETADEKKPYLVSAVLEQK